MEVNQHRQPRPLIQPFYTMWESPRGSKAIANQDTLFLRVFYSKFIIHLFKVLLTFQVECVGTLGDHGRRRQHQKMTLLVFPFSWSCQLHDFRIHGRTRQRSQLIHVIVWEEALTHGTNGKIYPIRRTQCGGMTSGRCNFFDGLCQSRETRGRVKMCSSLSRYQ